MARPYPAEFRARAIALVRAGKPQKQTADDLGIHPVTLSTWIKQDDIDRGGASRCPDERITRVARCAATNPGAGHRAPGRHVPRGGQAPPTRIYPVIDRLVDAGAPVDRCCKVLGIARQNYYKHKRKPTTATQLRRQWLTGLIREIHVASRGTYGYRRVHAELTLGMGITVCPRTVSVLMTLAGIYGLPGPVRVKRLRGVVAADDLVNRKFHRLSPNELWVTDITQHRTREGWLYCCAVLDAFSRRIVGWSMDSKADASLVVNALDMAIRNRRPAAGGIVHADHGTHFTS
ncbi:IS3 family transposase [Mycolicibacterium sp. CBM1]